MKTIRQTLILLTFALFFAANVTAAPLDERQRTVETVVADALAQLPAATAGDYDKIMGELAATGAEGVGILADMLVPASQGENAAVEYALNGVASFVTAAGREQLRPAVCEGLLAALARCKDDANRAFLVSQLQLCATADNAAALAAFEHTDEQLSRVEHLRETREATAAWLKEQTYKDQPLEVAESGSNFLLFGGHFDKREAIFDELLKRGVLIRVVGPDGWLRVCMGTDEEMETFRNALVEVLRIVEAA